jgi:predicted kinase
MLIVLHGLPGVGKSTLAEKIAEMTGGMVLGSNYIRRQIFGCDAYACANVPLMPFTDQEIILSYRTILYCAKLVLSCGKTVIMDATFQKKIYVEMAKEIAQKANTPFFLIKVVCDENVCKERMDKREKERKSDSIVGYAHHVEVKEKIFEEYDPVDFTFDSSKDPETQYQHLDKLLKSR